MSEAVASIFGEVEEPEVDPAEAPPEHVLADAAETIRRLASGLTLMQTGARSRWAAIGAELLKARRVSANKHEFGAWVSESGISSIPGLTAAASRSDAMWIVERPECAALIPAEITHPRRIRAGWRDLLEAAVKAQADELIKAGATLDPIAKIAAAEAISAEVKATEEEATEALAAALGQSAVTHQQALKALHVPANEGIPQDAWSALISAALKAKKKGLTYEDARLAMSAVWPKG